MADNDHVLIAAPIDSDSVGRGGSIATAAVMRVLSIAGGTSGTGFLHKSGRVITAEHVVSSSNEAILVRSDQSRINAKVVHADVARDLAIIEPESPIKVAPLPIAQPATLAIGAYVSTWGYPGGYNGAGPMLSAGHLSAVDGVVVGAQIIQKWVVNAAFNSGNSGGPLMLVETGEVIGVVSSKLAPLSDWAKSCLGALETQSSGLQYQTTDASGKIVSLGEGQIVAAVLNELRQQVQLVIGYAATLDDLRAFLESFGIEP